jgi:hypothetical protein
LSDQFGCKVHLLSPQGMCRYGRAVGSGLLAEHCVNNNAIIEIFFQFIKNFDFLFQKRRMKILHFAFAIKISNLIQ